jgi:3-oxoadipate enol-lactonase
MGIIERPNGITIPFEVQGAGNGPRLVFAHGLMGTGTAQRLQLPLLIDAGWTVATFDQRGHGGASPVLDASLYDADAMGADLWAVADAAGLDRCWIGGGSMGAATSFRAARQQPGRVEGLIQVVPAIRDEEHSMRFLFDALADIVRDQGIEGAITTLRQLTESMGRVEQDEVFLEQLRTHDEASLENALRTVPRWIFDDVPSAFAHFDFPVLVLGWEDDPIHPMQTARDIAAAAGVSVIEMDQDEALSDRTTLGRLLAQQLASAPA